MENDENGELKRIRKYQEGRAKPVLVQLMEGRVRENILKNSKKLKRMDIWVNDHYLKGVQEERIVSVEYMREARQKGLNAYVRYDKLIVNGEVYTADEVERNTGHRRESRGENEADKGQKRMLSQRSPDGHSLDVQLSKVTGTGRRKN